MSSLPQLMRYRILSAPSEPTEFWLAALTSTVGLWLANPTVDSLMSMAPYDWIPGYVDEDIIGLVILCVGLSRLWGLVAGNIKARMASAFLASCFWGANCLIIAQNNPWSAIAPVFAVLWCVSVWTYSAMTYQSGVKSWSK